MLEHVGPTTEFASLAPDGTKTPSEATRNRMIAAMQALCTDAHLAGKHDSNIGEGLKSFTTYTTADDDRVQVYSREDMQRFADHFDRPTQTVTYPRRSGGQPYQVERPTWMNVYDPDAWKPSDRFWLLALTGFIMSEARGIRVDDDEGNWIRLRKTLPKRASELRPYGKTDARMDDRRLPVSSKLREVLDRLHAYTKDGHLLTGPDRHRDAV